jgi:hypothetical protein
MHRFRFVVPLLLGLAAAAAPATSFAQVSIGFSITVAPPLLPVYEQPPIPGPGYIWTPGYWAYGPDGYYWVPGTWVLPPEVGLLWTPGWWGWNDGAYVFNAGYWGPEVGFYGGVDYGYGYTGEGYQGGYWNHGSFFYNRAVSNISSVRITNVYSRTVINNTTINRVSYNGGHGGIAARPTPQQEAFAYQRHIAPTSWQLQHQQVASRNHGLLASVNGGRPPIAATRRPNEFAGADVTAARNAELGAERRQGAPGLVAAGPRGGAATQGARPALRTPAEEARSPAAAGMLNRPEAGPRTAQAERLAPHPGTEAQRQATAVPRLAPHPVGPAPHPQTMARPAAPVPQMAARPAPRPASPAPHVAARPAPHPAAPPREARRG